MKHILEELVKDKAIDLKFIGRLKENGFTIRKGKFYHWINQYYIDFGDDRIWLVKIEEKSIGKVLVAKTRNELIQELNDIT